MTKTNNPETTVLTIMENGEPIEEIVLRTDKDDHGQNDAHEAFLAECKAHGLPETATM